MAIGKVVQNTTVPTEYNCANCNYSIAVALDLNTHLISVRSRSPNLPSLQQRSWPSQDSTLTPVVVSHHELIGAHWFYHLSLI